jgi:hypothetical protein
MSPRIRTHLTPYLERLRTHPLPRGGSDCIQVSKMGSRSLICEIQIFSVVNTVLLQPLPYEQPQQLVMLSSEQRNQALDGRGTFSVPDFFDVQKSATTLQYVATVQRSGTIVSQGGDPERVIGAVVRRSRC